MICHHCFRFCLDNGQYSFCFCLFDARTFERTSRALKISKSLFKKNEHARKLTSDRTLAKRAHSHFAVCFLTSHTSSRFGFKCSLFLKGDDRFRDLHFKERSLGQR